MRIIYFLALVTLTLVNCKSQKNSSLDESSKAQEASGLTLLMRDNYGGTENEELMVYKSQAELDKFFAKVNRTRKPGIRPPAIDFNKNMAVVYCPGKTKLDSPVNLYARDTGEKQIVISPNRAELSENQESNALLMPFGLYIMPLTDKAITLQE